MDTLGRTYLDATRLKADKFGQDGWTSSIWRTSTLVYPYAR